MLLSILRYLYRCVRHYLSASVGENIVDEFKLEGAFVSLFPAYIARISPVEKLGARLGE